MSKTLINLLRHGSLPREDDGTIEFWRLKDDLQTHFLCCHHWADDKCQHDRGGNKNCFTEQCDYSGPFLPVHLSYWMCDHFTLHHKFRIDTGRTKFEQQTDSALSAFGSHGKNHRDPDKIDLETPHFAQYMHEAWKTHDIGLTFYQTRSNAIILSETQLVVSRKLS